jgi:hypothetical protein
MMHRRGGNFSERRLTHRNRGISELRVMESVEKTQFGIEMLPLQEARRLQDRNIPVKLTRPLQDTNTRIAE